MCGPKLPSIAPGPVLHWPGGAGRQHALKALDDASVRAVAQRGHRARHPAAPATSTVPRPRRASDPAPSWNCLTATSVAGPNTPSTASDRFGVRRSARCSRLTAAPVAPGCRVGWPGFGIVPPLAASARRSSLLRRSRSYGACGLKADTGAHATPPRIRGNVAIRLTFLVFGLVVFAVGHRLHLRVRSSGSRPGTSSTRASRSTPGSRSARRTSRSRSSSSRVARRLDVRIEVGTVANAVLVGTFVDLLLRIAPSRTSATTPLAIRIGLLVGGILLIGLGDGPLPGCGDGRRAARLADARRSPGACTPASGSCARGLEVTATLVGFALGGTVGIGTLAFAFGIGPAIELSFALLARSPLVARATSADAGRATSGRDLAAQHALIALAFRREAACHRHRRTTRPRAGGRAPRDGWLLVVVGRARDLHRPDVAVWCLRRCSCPEASVTIRPIVQLQFVTMMMKKLMDCSASRCGTWWRSRPSSRPGSFARAAEQLGYTQSAISLQIAALERAAGTRLLERPGGRKPVVPTDAGARMLRHAARLSAQLQAAEAELTALAEGTANTLRVGTFQSVSISVLPDAVRRADRGAPGHRGAPARGLVGSRAARPRRARSARPDVRGRPAGGPVRARRAAARSVRPPRTARARRSPSAASCRR